MEFRDVTDSRESDGREHVKWNGNWGCIEAVFGFWSLKPGLLS